jgi:outer membrane protein
MKNLSLIINGVLAVALGVLFVLHFSLRSKVAELESSPIGVKSGGASTIAYINTDSLNAKYDYYIDQKALLLGKQKKMEDQLAEKKSMYERSVMEYQEKSQKGLLLRSEAAKIEQQLGADQQNLMRLSENLQGQLAEESQVVNRKLLNNIVDYLKEYNKNGRYQYILGHAFGSNLLYTNDSLDITNVVLKGLNQKYSSEKKK